MGRGGRGESRTQRLYKAAHVPDLDAHAGPEGHDTGRALREFPDAMYLSNKPARVARKDQVEAGISVIDDRGWNNGDGSIAVAKGRRGEGGLFEKETFNDKFVCFQIRRMQDMLHQMQAKLKASSSLQATESVIDV